MSNHESPFTSHHNSMLIIDNVSKRYGGVQALNQVSLEVPKGMIKGIIGPNGAGKSTLFHLISGVEAPDSGRISFKGTEITLLKPHEIALLGMGRTFQTIQTWGNMTVVDNILAGMHRRLKGGFLSCGLWLPGIRSQEKRALKEAKDILEFLGLLGRWEWPASQLSFGEQKMLEMGRALAMNPEFLLLDEPASGLTPVEVDHLSQRVQRMRQEGMTFLIIEHRLELVLEIAEEIAVLHNGELIAEGPPDKVRTNEKVIEAYLRPELKHTEA
jgi:ABC-type branched-subunit amino acid transport system ATPase component